MPGCMKNWSSGLRLWVAEHEVARMLLRSAIAGSRYRYCIDGERQVCTAEPVGHDQLAPYCTLVSLLPSHTSERAHD